MIARPRLLKFVVDKMEAKMELVEPMTERAGSLLGSRDRLDEGTRIPLPRRSRLCKSLLEALKIPMETRSLLKEQLLLKALRK